MRKPGERTISTDAESGEPFLARWSRRKRHAVVAPDAAPAAAAPAAEPDADAPSVPKVAGHAAVSSNEYARESAPAATPVAVGETEEIVPVLSDADMPDLASIGADDDYSGFMSPGVSEGLRNKALRQLFMSPQFNVLDGLNDYDDDFRSFEPLGDIVTSDMRHRAQMEAERAERDAQAQRLPGDDAEQQVLAEDAAQPRTIAADADADAQDLDGRGRVPGNEPGEAPDPEQGGAHEHAAHNDECRDECADGDALPDNDDGRRAGSLPSARSDKEDA